MKNRIIAIILTITLLVTLAILLWQQVMATGEMIIAHGMWE